MKSPLLAAVAVLLLAGCIHQPPLQPQAPQAYRFQGYSFPEPLALDGQAEPLASHPLMDAAARPRFVERLLPGGGAEPNIGITSSGALFVTTYDQVRRSTDHGVTWETVFDFHSPNAPQTMDVWSTTDPMLWADPDTDRVFVVHMQGYGLTGTECLFVAWTDDEGTRWTDERPLPIAPGMGACPIPFVDHPKIVTGRPGPEAKAQPQGYRNMVYICTNKVESLVSPPLILGTWCQASYDGGATWEGATNAFPPDDDCPGLNGHPAVGADGTLYVPAGNLGGKGASCQQPPRVAVSRDSGLTFTVRTCDVCGIQRSIDADIAFTPDGTAYMVFTSEDSMTYLVRSKDKFQTWEGPFRLSPRDHTMDVFGAMTAGDDGRIAVAYLGSTTQQPEEFKDADASGAIGGTRWHLYLTTSLDAGSAAPTFLTQQVTPNEDPVQIGCIWLKGGASPCRNLLDFIDLHHDADGRGYVAFTDGCNPRSGCTTDPDSATYQSHDTDVAVAVLDSGTGLFAAKGLLPSLGLTFPPAPDPRAHRDGGSP
ncbi:MAG TPA: sialidase family protein [Candidatus Thermoplasmatota archaeon]|nr:sialidase family protein [Candidatus Thermoplasmatota archaeon]